MARTADPNSVVWDTKAVLTASVEQFVQLTEAVDLLTVSSARKLELHRQVAADALMRAAVAFESFRSDWHVRAINRAPATFEASIKGQIASAFNQKWSALGVAAPTVTLPKFTVSLIQDVLDPRGMNVEGFTDPPGPTMTPGTNWKKKAVADLDDPFKTKVVSLPAADFVLINAVIRIRNAIAHRSTASLKAMNEALALPGLDAALTRTNNTNVSETGIGTYLGATSGGKTRVVQYHDRLDAIVTKLLVPASPTAAKKPASAAKGKAAAKKPAKKQPAKKQPAKKQPATKRTSAAGPQP